MECKQDGIEVTYLVEANTFEQGVLWEKWNKKVEWKQHLTGNMSCVGYVGETKEFPVYVSLSHNYINEKKIVFWYVSGMYADYAKVESFLKKEFPECFYTMPYKKAEAGNFHIAVHATQEA